MSNNGVFRLVGVWVSVVLALPSCLLAAKAFPPVKPPLGKPPVEQPLPVSQPSTQAASHPAAEAPAAEEDPNSIAAEERRFETTYGKRFENVQKTPGENDDRAFAGELVQEAENQLQAGVANKAYVLARKALELTATLTDEKAANLAKRAITIQVKAKGLSPTDQVMLWRENAMARLEAGKAKKKECFPLAQMAAEASVEYAQALSKEPDATQAVGDALASAAALVSEYKITGLANRVALLQKSLQEVKAREERIALLNKKLLELPGDAKPAVELKRELGDLYLRNGNISAAAKSFLGTGDHREAALTTAAAFLDNTGAVPAAFPAAVEKLAALAKISTEPARTNLALCGQRMCDNYLENSPAEDKIAAISQFKIQLEAISGVRLSSELEERVQKRFGPLKGQLDVLGSRIRVAYDFAKEEQIKDWSPRGDGQWGVGGGVLACRGRPYNTAFITNKVSFQADKPWRIQFAVSARINFAASFVDPVTDETCLRFSLDKEFMRLRIFDSTGHDNNIRLQPSAPYKVVLEFDGKTQLKCTLNGRVVLTRDNVKPWKMRGQLSLSCDHSLKEPTVFDNIVIEGKPRF